VTAFEHIILLLSFVYALALTHLLSGTAALIRARSRVVFSWFQAGWMANAFVIIVADWISFFDLRTTPVWNMGTILFVLCIAVANYLQAALVCVDVPDEGPVDMVSFHARQARTYIAAVVVSVVLAVLANVVLGGAFDIKEYVRQNLVVFPMLVASVTGLIWVRGWMQATALVALGVLWIVYFTGLQSALH
jgi:hypothetical protein